jgi:hypothetical protein
MLQEIECELNKMTVKDDVYQSAWEWLRLFQAVMTESMRTRQWLIDIQPIGHMMLCQLGGLDNPVLNKLRLKFQSTLKVIDDYVAESS